jgi:hypothetical protein
MSITYNAYIEAQYNEKPNLMKYYGSLAKFKANYIRSHGISDWLETLRDKTLTIKEMISVARTFVSVSKRKASELPMLLASITRQYNVELPVEHGILTPEYWEPKVQQWSKVNGLVMKVTNVCDKKTILHEGNHYLPYPENLEIVDGKLAVPYCFYNGKWRQDIIYLTDRVFIEKLFGYAIKRKLITAIPKIILI